MLNTHSDSGLPGRFCQSQAGLLILLLSSKFELTQVIFKMRKHRPQILTGQSDISYQMMVSSFGDASQVCVPLLSLPPTVSLVTSCRDSDSKFSFDVWAWLASAYYANSPGRPHREQVDEYVLLCRGQILFPSQRDELPPLWDGGPSIQLSYARLSIFILHTCLHRVC